MAIARYWTHRVLLNSRGVVAGLAATSVYFIWVSWENEQESGFGFGTNAALFLTGAAHGVLWYYGRFYARHRVRIQLLRRLKTLTQYWTPSLGTHQILVFEDEIIYELWHEIEGVSILQLVQADLDETVLLRTGAPVPIRLYEVAYGSLLKATARPGVATLEIGEDEADTVYTPHFPQMILPADEQELLFRALVIDDTELERLICQLERAQPSVATIDDDED